MLYINNFIIRSTFTKLLIKLSELNELVCVSIKNINLKLNLTLKNNVYVYLCNYNLCYFKLFCLSHIVLKIVG